jgi:hypothetical protein
MYLFFGVSVADFDQIVKRRGHGAARLFYLGEIEILIIKIPTRIHEAIHAAFADEFTVRVCDMGLEFCALGLQ